MLMKRALFQRATPEWIIQTFIDNGRVLCFGPGKDSESILSSSSDGYIDFISWTLKRIVVSSSQVHCDFFLCFFLPSPNLISWE